MRDVLVLCEGQTEREFCRSVLSEYLAGSGVALAGTWVGKPQSKRGGIKPWETYRRELTRLAKERVDRTVSVLVDYYKMPETWPGRKEAATKPPGERGRYVEEQLREDLKAELEGRFVPCVQLHEFESLLFVDPAVTAQQLAVVAGQSSSSHLEQPLRAVLKEFRNRVEEINDTPQGAPSKRMKDIVSSYDKVAWGIKVVNAVGVDCLRQGCPWLDRWLTSLALIGSR